MGGLHIEQELVETGLECWKLGGRVRDDFEDASKLASCDEIAHYIPRNFPEILMKMDSISSRRRSRKPRSISTGRP